MAKTDSLTAARLRELLEYDPLTGLLRWRAPTGNCRVGWFAGSLSASWKKRAYHRKVRIGQTYFYVHRIAFLYMTGAWPKAQVDHRDRDGLNNIWANLREATPAQNSANRAGRGCKSGVKGVHREHNRYLARIMVDGRRIVIGSYETLDLAAMAYASAANDLHGEFARAA